MFAENNPQRGPIEAHGSYFAVGLSVMQSVSRNCELCSQWLGDTVERPTTSLAHVVWVEIKWHSTGCNANAPTCSSLLWPLEAVNQFP